MRSLAGQCSEGVRLQHPSILAGLFSSLRRCPMVRARGGGEPMTLWGDSWIRGADSCLGSKRELQRGSALQFKDCHAQCVRTPLMPFGAAERSEEHTSELQSLMRISYAVFCLKKKLILQNNNISTQR